MKTAIIDDLTACREKIRDCLYRYLNETYAGETPVIECFSGGEEFLSRFTPGAYDIIFLDQYMNGLSGLDTANRIREQDPLTALIFVTASRDYAVDSYGVRACGYLVKPYDYEEFRRTISLAGLEKIRSSRFIRLEDKKILLRDILWCGRSNHYVEIHTNQCGLLRFRLAFASLTGLLVPYPQFLTCYKGCIVNLDHVECMDGLSFKLDTGETVPFAIRDRKQIEAQYYAYRFQREREDVLL